MSILYDLYPSVHIEYMLLAESWWGAALLFRSVLAVRIKKFSPRVRLINIVFSGVSLLIGMGLIIDGIMVGFNVLIGMGIFIGLAAIREVIILMRQSPLTFRWRPEHYYGMLVSCLLLPFNGTGFFGIRDIFDMQGDVPLPRVFLSYLPFCVLILGIDIFHYWSNRSKQSKSSSLSKA